jgi:hypothetical protein
VDTTETRLIEPDSMEGTRAERGELKIGVGEVDLVVTLALPAVLRPYRPRVNQGTERELPDRRGLR